jgi:hypothetical protein
MKNAVFWYIRPPVRTSQQTHYVSAPEASPLILWKFWGFHGSDYEECRLLVYKNPVRTSQETHYVSATKASQLMLSNIWGSTAVTMKNAVFWDKSQFVPHKRHITFQLQRPARYYYVIFAVFTVVTMNNGVFWDVTPCGSCKNRRFGGT